MSRRKATVAVFALLVVAGCTSDKPTAAVPQSSAAPNSQSPAGTGEQSKFFVQADYDAQLAMRSQTPEGPPDKPWEQAIAPQMIDTATYKKDGPYKIAFASQGPTNSWAQIYDTALRGDRGAGVRTACARGQHALGGHGRGAARPHSPRPHGSSGAQAGQTRRRRPRGSRHAAGAR